MQIQTYLPEREAEEHHKATHANLIEGVVEKQKTMHVNMKYVNMRSCTDYQENEWLGKPINTKPCTSTRIHGGIEEVRLEGDCNDKKEEGGKQKETECDDKRGAENKG